MKRSLGTAILFVPVFILIPILVRAETDPKFLYRKLPDVAIHIEGRTDSSLLAFCKEQPTMISLVYSQCGGICYPFVNELRDQISGIGDGRKSYRMLILSIDERDTPESMASMAKTVGLSGNAKWIFGTIEGAQIRLLTSSVGFEFVKDTSTGQIDHPPILIGVDTMGRIVRVLRNFANRRQELWELYRDIQGEYIPVSREGRTTLVSCFTYDAKRGHFSMSWGMLVLYLPVALGGLIVWSVFRARRA